MQQLWKQTSQYRNWFLTGEELKQIRHENIKSALLKKQHQDTKLESIEEISQDHEQILQFYVQKIRDYTTFFALPYNVMATGIAIFKRFYLHFTLFEYSPKTVIPTLILLSCKIENVHLSMRRLVEETTIAESIIKEMEFTISQAIFYNFSIHHPFTPLHGLFLLSQTPGIGGKLEMSGKVYELAISIVIDSFYHSSIMFEFTPSQIAVGAYQMAYQAIVGDKWEYLDTLDTEQVLDHVRYQLESVSGFALDTKAVKKLMKKYQEILVAA